MTLRELIRQHNLSGTPEEIAAALNEKTVPAANARTIPGK